MYGGFERMNVRRYQKWAKSGLAIMMAGAMMVGTATSGGATVLRAAETENTEEVSAQKSVTSDAHLFFLHKNISFRI